MGVHKQHPERILLVEGKTDLYFIAELWRKQTGIEASKHFSIIASGGKEQLIQDVADFGNDRNKGNSARDIRVQRREGWGNS